LIARAEAFIPRLRETLAEAQEFIREAQPKVDAERLGTGGDGA
jgi:hypothetical protein